jgi:hypothetical protein
LFTFAFPPFRQAFSEPSGRNFRLRLAFQQKNSPSISPLTEASHRTESVIFCIKI